KTQGMPQSIQYIVIISHQKRIMQSITLESGQVDIKNLDKNTLKEIKYQVESTPRQYTSAIDVIGLSWLVINDD
ncbi:MAG: hypothetical protein ACE5R5_06205, partial [Nitrosarchaeum sp.]